MRSPLADKKFSLAFGPLILAAFLGMWFQGLFRSPTRERAPSAAAAVSSATRIQSDENVPDVVDRVTPAVVSVFFTRAVTPSPLHRTLPLNPFDLAPLPQQGLGSGLIASPDGLILTNQHVVRQANDIRIVLWDRREFKAQVVGSDAPTDVAVLRIDAKGLPALPFGDSSKVRVGQSVLAIGNSFGVGQTVSMGIVSARGRANVGVADYEDFLQTDAAINPGNSGGPLVNLKGEVVGINTAIASRTGGFQGIGFAIPSNMAREVMELIVKHGKVDRGQLGVVGQDMTPQLARAIDGAPIQGVLVSEVLEKGGAQEAGLRRGDIIVELDGQPVSAVADLRNRVALRGAGAEAKLKVWREQKMIDITVRLREPEAHPKEASDEEPMAREENRGSPSGVEGIFVTPATPSLLRRLGLPRDGHGLIVSSVAASASFTGLKVGDLITEADRHPVATAAAMEKAMHEAKSEFVLLTVQRREGVLFVPVPRK